jgi:hypothetical protein
LAQFTYMGFIPCRLKKGDWNQRFACKKLIGFGGWPAGICLH